ncbi:hypothetical protein Gocc_3111 [Gaiella occulta]|uniref:Uncharacterized protein n=1 Tax=Gaiella occulta TaxID=1002870 RepID=A0A7M2YSJ4_9ACTN|nr:hypothetical protein Gocc_3111 [Gaiella occulta]
MPSASVVKLRGVPVAAKPWVVSDDRRDGLHWPHRDGLKWPHLPSGFLFCES